MVSTQDLKPRRVNGPSSGAALGLLLASLLLCFTARWPAAASDQALPKESIERSDLELPRTLWHTLPTDIRRVKIGPDGRPWFVSENRGAQLSVDEFERHVEAASKCKTPWVRCGEILLIDRHGRIWCQPQADQGLLLGYDPATSQWMERRVTIADAPHNNRNRFELATYENRTGRLYFADRLGLHVLDGQTWSYQPLYEENQEQDLYYDLPIRHFNLPEFAEDDDGRVFVWSNWGRCGWTGTVGCFVHDGQAWERRRVHEPGQAEKDLAARSKNDGNRGKELASLLGLRGVIPLRYPWAVLMPDSGAARLVRAPIQDPTLGPRVEAHIARLNNEAFDEREKASQDLRELGPEILPLLRKALDQNPEAETTARLHKLIELIELSQTDEAQQIDGYAILNAHPLLRDKAGHTWFYVDSCRTPEGTEIRNGIWRISPEGKISLAPKAAQDWYPDGTWLARNGHIYFARYKRGCEAVDGEQPVPVTSPAQDHLRYILGDDAEGRLFLTDEQSVFAYHPDWPDARHSLTTTIFETPRGENGVCLDSHGRIWAQVLLPQADRAQLAVYDNGAWHVCEPNDANPNSKDLVYFQPLRDCGLVLQWNSKKEACFYDGDQWHTFKNLVDLVQQRYDQLVKRVDNMRRGRDFYAKLRVDTAGRIWIVQWDQVHVYDGKQLTDIGELVRQTLNTNSQCDFCFCMPNGPEVLLAFHHSGLLASLQDGRWLVEQAKLPGKLDSDYTTRSGLWNDSQGRLWLPRNPQSSGVVEKSGARMVEDTGYPRLEDSAGRVWFTNTRSHELIVMDRDGKRTRLQVPPFPNDACLVEDRPGSVWMVTDEGLLNLEAKNGPAVKILQHYTKDVPRGRVLEVFIDRNRNLWFYGPGPNNYRLYQVQLPTANSDAPP